MIIDSHNHLGGPDKGDGATQSPDEIIQKMDAAGVERAVIFPFNEIDPGPSFSKANDFISRAVDHYPDRLIGFARLDPHEGELAIQELERSVQDLLLKGVKLHPKGQNFSPANIFVQMILEKASELDIPVVFDNGKEIFDNRAIGALAGKVPDVNIIMAHMRGEGYLDVARNYSNIYLGTVKARLEDVSKAISLLGPNTIIAGSDSPYSDMDFEMKGKFEKIKNLSKDDVRLISGDNVEKLLGLKG
jgi:predicted TIM-barrel fold metal-dependent hydrolase